MTRLTFNQRRVKTRSEGQEVRLPDGSVAQLTRPTCLTSASPQNVMILGDFNADGGYVSKQDMKRIRIRTDKKFHWLIGDDVDTTASNQNDHTYDR